jgi:uncharacterized membrane protein YkvA (DUF1232 family)
MTDTAPPQASVVSRLKTWARGIKRDVVTVYFAARDPQAPLLVRILAGLVAAYALSPIDLIPDFIPVLGYLDDLLIVPLGLLLVMRLMPEGVMTNARVKADTLLAKPRSWLAAVCFVAIWLAMGVYLALWLF